MFVKSLFKVTKQTQVTLMLSQQVKYCLLHHSLLRQTGLHKVAQRNFARIKSKGLLKSSELLQGLTEKKSLDDELQAYEFNLDYTQVRQLDNIATTKGVLSFFEQSEPTKINPIFKVHIMGKLVNNVQKDRINIVKFIQGEEFKKFYQMTKMGISQMDAKALSSFILYSAKLGFKDKEVLEFTKEKISIGNFRQISPIDLSQFLFAFGMAKYNDEYLMGNIMRKLSNDHPVNLVIANRNLWA